MIKLSRFAGLVLVVVVLAIGSLPGLVVEAAAIDIGPAATNRSSNISGDYTFIDVTYTVPLWQCVENCP